VYHDDNYDSGEYSGLATMDYRNFSVSTFSSTGIEDSVGVVPIGSDISNKIRHDHLDAGYKLDLNDDLYVNTNFTLNHMKWYPSPNPSLQSRDYLGEATAHYQMLDNLKVIAGQTVEYRDGMVTSVNYNNHWYSTYGQMEYTPVEKLKLVGGVQYNKVEGADGSFVPRFGAIYNHNEHLGAKLLYGEAFRGASALETDIQHPVIIGNPALTPEKIRTYDATVFYNTADYNVSATYFNSKMTDIISRRLLVPPASTYVNAGEISTDGVELESKWRLNSRWSFEANATLQSNEDGNGAANATADSDTMLKGGISYNTQHGVVLSAFDSYFAEAAAYPAAAQVNPAADDYHLLSATVNMDLHELAGNGFQGMQFTLHGANLLDEDVYYPEFARQRINTLPQASGRLLYGTFSMKF
jgi:outer membrane receptor for ferrienterochelin and colicins